MRVGFVGLGNMGKHIALRLLGAGHQLTVYDVRADAADSHVEAGATLATSPAEVMQASEVTFTSLPEPGHVTAVALGADGLIEAAGPGKALIDLSTNSVSVVREIHRRFLAEGAAMCDAPVSGGPTGAAHGKLAVYVGGDETVVETYRPVIETFSDQMLYVGEIGGGTVAKLMHQSVGFIVNAAIAEVFTVGVRAGVEPAALWRALRTGAVGRRRTFDGIEANFLCHEFDRSTFTLALAHKDARLAVGLGRELDVPMPFAELTLADMTEGLDRGWAGRSSYVTMLLQEERGDVDVRLSPDELDRELSSN